MLPHREGTLTPPHILRRRQLQSHCSEAGPPNLNRFPLGCPNQMLDLSMCRPSQAFNNRFSVLATPPSSLPKSSTFLQDFPNTSTRRTRYSRGTKEAKKRRDMRRNRRKLAAQLLDQQLSQAFDETVTKANVTPSVQLSKPRLLPALPAPVPAIPIAGFPLPRPAYLPPTPPELSLPDFSAFDLSAFPHLTVPHTTPPPLRTPTPFRTLPKWCPKIPSLTLGDVWRDCLPTFHDLSSLPEPAEVQSLATKATMRESSDYFQLRRPIGTGYGRDRSRFFPPRKLLTTLESGSALQKRAKVKLPPPVACRLHRSDNSVDIPLPKTKSFIAETAMAALADLNVSDTPTTPAGDRIWQLSCTPPVYEEEEMKAVPRFVPDPVEQILDEAAATMMWHGYESKGTNTDLSIDSGPCPNNFLANEGHAQHRRDSTNTSPPSYHAAQSLYELEAGGVQLPYVHANSLIGYSDNTDATGIFTSYKTPETLVDSAVSLPIILSSEYQDMVGLNKLVIDHDITVTLDAKLAADVSLPLSFPITPLPSPPPQSLGDIAAILPINCITEAEYVDSDAHYHSEQALFVQSPLSLAQSIGPSVENSEFSSINIADFLKLGHAKQCWCGHCIDKSYDATQDEAKSSVTSSLKRTDEGCTDEGDYEYALSMLLHPTESEPDTESDGAELFDDISKETYPKQPDVDDIDAREDDGWLLFSPVVTMPAKEHLYHKSPLYLPSSPILHRQDEQQQRASTPIVVVTSPSQPVVEPSDEYIAVAAPVTTDTNSNTTKNAWHDMFPRSPSSAWKTSIATYKKAVESGLTNAMEGSWRWGRETEEEWWDWAVEEEC